MLLFFSMQLDDTPALNRGRLFLIDDDKGIIGRWVATSGLGQYQNTGDWSKQGGGVIPATYQLRDNLPFYTVATKPTDLRAVKGIEGNGYVISPYSVTTTEGIKRADLLIHKDANQPGSLGCIVLSPAEFATFEKTYQANCLSLDCVKLLVGYSY